MINRTPSIPHFLFRNPQLKINSIISILFCYEITLNISQNLKLLFLMKNTSSPLITEVQFSSQIPEIDRALKDQLTKDLSPEDLSKIKQGFDLYRGTVDLKQFIIIMLQALYNTAQIQTRQKQILTFIEMFLLIDLKNHQKIKFQDFTNYLIDRQSNKNNIEEYQFFPAENLNSIDLQTDGVYPLTGNKMFAILQSTKKEVALIETKTFKKNKIVGLGGNIINNIIYLPDYDVYVLATNDKHLNFYQTGDDTLIQRFSTPDTIQFLLYLDQEKILISGCTNGRIYQFNVKKILANMKKQNKGSSQIDPALKKISPQDLYKYFIINKVCKDQPDLTCLESLKSLEMLVTGSNDSKVRIYEIRQNGLKMSKELDGHYKGIKAVTVSVHHKIIVSCSFDFDVLVWNAYLQHPVARLEGHQASLVSAYCPKQHQIIITLDAKSVMKIWSSEKYHLIQNIVVYENLQPNTSIKFCYKEELNIAIVYTKKLLFFKYSVNYDPKLTDDHEITAIKYSNKNLEVYVGSHKSLKVWCIERGVEKRNYVNVVDSEISVLEIDERHRRCFIGCLNGSIQSLDLFSGLIIQKYSSHKNEISLLKYNAQHNLLISGSWDRKIKIHNDTNHLQRIESRENVLRNINNISEKDLSGGSFSLTQLFIATFCKTPFVKVWDFEKGFLQAQYLLPADVCQVQFIDPFPLVLISDIKGSIFIFTTKYYTQAPYKLLTQWKNMYSIQKSSQITYIKSHYNPKTKECDIILGDQYGYIRVISLTAFIEELQLKPVPAELVGNKNPYRIEDYNYRNVVETSGANIHDFSKYNCSNLVPPPTIRQKLQIKGHNEKINYVQIIRQSEQELILSASSDCLVKIWSGSGQIRGTLRQGAKQNKLWGYNRNSGWKNNEIILYEKIRSSLQSTQEDYFFKKRMQTVPFTLPEKFQQATNQDIYKNLKEIDSLLYKPTEYKSSRKY